MPQNILHLILHYLHFFLHHPHCRQHPILHYLHASFTLSFTAYYIILLHVKPRVKVVKDVFRLFTRESAIHAMPSTQKSLALDLLISCARLSQVLRWTFASIN